MAKHPKMETALENLFGRSTAHVTGTCSGCQGPAMDFASNLQVKEYGLSGLCRVCQEEIFGPAKETP